MYMPGRLRTASRPSRTVMSLASYEEPLAALLVFAAVRLAAPLVREELFLLAPPRWGVFATQLPFGPINGCLDLRDPAPKVLCGQEGRGLTTSTHKSTSREPRNLRGSATKSLQMTN